MILPVRLYTEPILHKPCELITDFTSLESFAGDLLQTMLAYRGVGLAANQVGISKQLCVMNLEDKTKMLVIANPKILRYTKETTSLSEGCLSCPGISVNMKRPLGVEIEAQNLAGEVITLQFTDYDARIFFHEYAHLLGKTIADDLKRMV